eukprot:11174104-Lingulodinium_polyedra.AAC.1
MQKAFLRPVVGLAQLHRRPSAVHTYGFKANCSCAQVSELLRMVLDKANSFGKSCYVLSADIKTAFQLLSHDAVQRALRRYEVPPLLRRCLLEELTGLRVKASLPGVDAPEGFIPYTRGGREGGVDTPTLFNITVEDALEDVVQKWKEEGGGFPLNDFHGVTQGSVSHAIWADNIWLVAPNLDEVLQHFYDVTSALRAAGFEWKAESLEVMA